MAAIVIARIALSIAVLPLVLRWREVSQIRRRLILLGRHQEAVGAEEVPLPADLEMGVALGADAVAPDRARVLHAAIFLDRRPRTRERVVECGDLDDEDVRIGLVLVDPFLEHALIIRVQRQSGVVIGAWSLEAARLDLEHAVAAAAALIDPGADRVARKRRLDEFGPRTAVGIDAARIVDVLHEYVRRVRRDAEFRSLVVVHDARHAGRETSVGRIAALPAGALLGEARLQECLKLGLQRRLLPPPQRLARIVARGTSVGAHPLALPVGIFGFIKCPGVAEGQADRRHQCHGSQRIARAHLLSSLAIAPGCLSDLASIGSSRMTSTSRTEPSAEAGPSEGERGGALAA